VNRAIVLLKEKSDKLSQPGINFTSILRKAFTHADPKSVKIQSGCQHLFGLLRAAE